MPITTAQGSVGTPDKSLSVAPPGTNVKMNEVADSPRAYLSDGVLDSFLCEVAVLDPTECWNASRRVLQDDRPLIGSAADEEIRRKFGRSGAVVNRFNVEIYNHCNQ